jgi:23S rRNA pseudouridine1911/1915/1917 synthase
MRLDHLWTERLGSFPRPRIQEWIRQGKATIDGQRCTKPGQRVRPGQCLHLESEPVTPASLQADPGPLQVCYADAHILVLHKPAGMTVHPAPSVEGPTLVERVAAHFPSLLQLGSERPGIVHRLDKDTSGLMVLALSETARHALTAAFAQRLVHKEYLAIASGHLTQPLRVDLPLDRHPTLKTRMTPHPQGRPALTEIWPLWQAPQGQATLVRARIHTGRTHQIRVHLSASGHPLVGDQVYAPQTTAAMAPRQMLHSWYLAFAHPITGEPLAFCAPPPEDFWQTLADLAWQPLRIGITGAVGCGKSTLADIWRAQGVPVLSADTVVAELYQPKAPGWETLRCHFGRRFTPDDTGPVDRIALRQAMNDPRTRREVEALIHPLVADALTHFWSAHCHAPVLAAEIPLLLEAGFRDACDIILAVFCPDDLRHERLAQRGWDAPRIAQMEGWQWSQEQKIRAAHLIVDNSGSLEDTKHRTMAALAIVQSRLQTAHTRILQSLRRLAAQGPPQPPAS